MDPTDDTMGEIVSIEDMSDEELRQMEEDDAALDARLAAAVRPIKSALKPPARRKTMPLPAAPDVTPAERDAYRAHLAAEAAVSVSEISEDEGGEAPALKRGKRVSFARMAHVCVVVKAFVGKVESLEAAETRQLISAEIDGQPRQRTAAQLQTLRRHDCSADDAVAVIGELIKRRRRGRAARLAAAHRWQDAAAEREEAEMCWDGAVMGLSDQALADIDALTAATNRRADAAIAALKAASAARGTGKRPWSSADGSGARKRACPLGAPLSTPGHEAQAVGAELDAAGGSVAAPAVLC